ncbi:class I SAM-dependent methyltransferase [Schleiferiaceae bacterium]|nr:class I SAM-dependent methyltransferase [Schleiferiaceae bacterium]
MNESDLTSVGASIFPLYLQSPYLFYENLLEVVVSSKMKVLDLCCGDGKHTIALGRLSDFVVATDIAENSIEIAKRRVEVLNLVSIQFHAGDAEHIKYPDNHFDIVTCIGSISYVNLEKFTAEIIRILKPGGRFIALDSLDHNPIYRLNRYIHYLKGNRTYTTLKRMPKEKTLQYFESHFTSIEKHYFGIFIFMGPILSFLLGPKNAKNVIDFCDKRLSCMKKYSFKFVLNAYK